MITFSIKISYLKSTLHGTHIFIVYVHHAYETHTDQRGYVTRRHHSIQLSSPMLLTSTSLVAKKWQKNDDLKISKKVNIFTTTKIYKQRQMKYEFLFRVLKKIQGNSIHYLHMSDTLEVPSNTTH